MSDPLERLRTALADRYTIEHELGAGGMATVYLAEDLKHHRKVAVKVLRPELAAILGAERFLKEIEVTAHLQHPHILPLFDSGEADSFLYYVMPHVEGESLRDKLNREKQLGVDETVEIAKGVAAALDYAHRQGVIHRDIKPENILIHDGQPVVADFGIALAVTTAGGTRLTETGLSLGTPEYMSPEQATGERELTGRTDVYSLGAVVYEMLAGEPPHTGATVQAIVARVVSAEPEPITTVRPSTPPNADAAVHRALAKVPGDRFATPSSFAAALADPRYAPHDWVASASSRGATIWKKRAAVIAVLGVLASVLTLFAVGANDRSRNPPRPIARLAFEAPGIASGARGTRIAVSADGSTIVYVAEDSSGTRLFMRRLDGAEPTLIPGTEQATHPFFSPDGEWIGFYQGAELKRMRLDGGTPSVIAGVEPSLGASWSAQDVIIFSGLQGLYTVPVVGGEPRLVLKTIPGGGVIVGRPHALPDGNSVLFTQYDVTRGAILAVLSLLDGTVTDLEQRGMYPHYVAGGIVVFAYDGQLVARQYDQRRKRLVGAAVPVAQGVGRIWRGQIGTMHLGVSATGTIAYLDESRGFSELVTVDRQANLEVLPAPPRRYQHPRFSPDGRHIVAGIALPDRPNSGDIWSYDVRMGTLSRLTFDSSSIYPEVTPDGQRVTFASVRDGDWDLYWMLADGRERERLFAREGHQWQALITPDLRTVAFYEFLTETRHDILVTSLDDPTAVRPLARSAARELAAAMSPDGRWLAYKSDATGTYEVYVQPVSEGGAAIPISPAGGHEPRWGPNSRELFYRNADSLYVVPFEAGNPPLLGRARLLFTNNFARSDFQANYDVHPDGERFVFVRERSNATGAIQVVLNWFDHWPGSR